MEISNRTQEGNPVSVNIRETGSQRENGMHQQVHYHVMSNRDQANKEETISQQIVPTAWNQR